MTIWSRLKVLWRCDHRDAIKEVGADGVLRFVCPFCGNRSIALQRSPADKKKLRKLQARIAQSKSAIADKPPAEVVPFERKERA